MSGHRKWREIRGPRTPEREARVAAGVAAIRMGQRLDEVRVAHGLTQTDMAQRMGVSQPHVAQVEARDDVYLSTLFSYVRALGGDLRIQAVFPDEDPVEISLGRDPDGQALCTQAPSPADSHESPARHERPPRSNPAGIGH